MRYVALLRVVSVYLINRIVRLHQLRAHFVSFRTFTYLTPTSLHDPSSNPLCRLIPRTSSIPRTGSTVGLTICIRGLTSAFTVVTTTDISDPQFHGIWPRDGGFAGPRPTPVLHPHLQLETTMTSVPKVHPGDMVFWHCDVVHSVELEHTGKGDSAGT